MWSFLRICYKKYCQSLVFSLQLSKQVLAGSQLDHIRTSRAGRCSELNDLLYYTQHCLTLFPSLPLFSSFCPHCQTDKCSRSKLVSPQQGPPSTCWLTTPLNLGNVTLCVISINYDYGRRKKMNKNTD